VGAEKHLGVYDGKRTNSYNSVTQSGKKPGSFQTMCSKGEGLPRGRGPNLGTGTVLGGVLERETSKPDGGGGLRINLLPLLLNLVEITVYLDPGEPPEEDKTVAIPTWTRKKREYIINNNKSDKGVSQEVQGDEAQRYWEIREWVSSQAKGYQT